MHENDSIESWFWWLGWCLFLLLLLFNGWACSGAGKGRGSAAVAAQQPFIATSAMRLRDPFILYDRRSGKYYTYVNNRPSIKAYRSSDLEQWEPVGNVFTADTSFWGKQDFWAPDCYYYQGKYYLFVTFSGSNRMRGTSVLVADAPDQQFRPLVNAPVTPAHWMCLDASLYIDKDDTPWILFSREWLEVTDGEIYAQQMSRNLKNAAGEPVLLFRASEAPWVKAIYSRELNKKGMITDAPFIHRVNKDKLVMLWSSFDKNGRYAMGAAYAPSGKVTGPWIQSDTALNNDDGGHGMLFYDKARQLKISYHAPNAGLGHLIIRNATIEKEHLSLQ
ncbi:glycoside hydrolase family 43 protein [Niabella sp. CC-SYL272]|uniref:glycoside hydrolase family 43 protein n=1 Tax=Niabella agricola TaxID=2891571 RepID=UPI001F48EC2C|nr:glycoside hydrolase family 43 protein [Niabella agricola]MCF3108740.1 glycoside hydrolase family 43 protein [Niabella agricola]